MLRRVTCTCISCSLCRARNNCHPVVRDKQIFLSHKSFFNSQMQGPRQVICQLNRKKSNLRLAQGKQNLRATCPKGKLEFKFFSQGRKKPRSDCPGQVNFALGQVKMEVWWPTQEKKFKIH